MTEASQGVGSGPEPIQVYPQNLQPATSIGNIPIGNLNDLKNVLVGHLGEHNGTLMYNFFIDSILQTGFTAIQGASQNAANAAKNMSKPQS